MNEFLSSYEYETVKLFYSYSHKDEELKNDLCMHLSNIRNMGLIYEWNDRKIQGGDEWKGEIDKNLDTAEVILLLVSSDFLGSSYCQEVEMKKALDRYKKGEARLVPVLLRPVEWQDSPLGFLQVLPKNFRPLTSWTNIDEGFMNVAKGIREVVEDVLKRKLQKIKRELWLNNQKQIDVLKKKNDTKIKALEKKHAKQELELIELNERKNNQIQQSWANIISSENKLTPIAGGAADTKEKKETEWILVLSARIDEVNMEVTKAIVEQLEKISGSSRITFIKKEAGSVLLFFRSSMIAYRYFFDAFYRRHLVQLLGYPIRHIYEVPADTEFPKQKKLGFNRISDLFEPPDISNELDKTINFLKKRIQQIITRKARIEAETASEKEKITRILDDICFNRLSYGSYVYITKLTGRQKLHTSGRAFYGYGRQVSDKNAAVFYEEYFEDIGELFQCIQLVYSKSTLVDSLFFLYDRMRVNQIQKKIKEVLDCIARENLPVRSFHVRTDLSSAFINKKEIAKLKAEFSGTKISILINDDDDNDYRYSRQTPGMVIS